VQTWLQKKKKEKKKRKEKKILHIWGQIIHNPDLISYNAVAILKIINGFARIMNIEEPVTKHPPICLLALCEEDQEAFAPELHHGAYQTKHKEASTKAASIAIPGEATQEQRRGIVRAILGVLEFVVRRKRRRESQSCLALRRPCQGQGVP